jgi:hypothetical protein
VVATAFFKRLEAAEALFEFTEVGHCKKRSYLCAYLFAAYHLHPSYGYAP